MKKEKGFTLIELVLVIIILGTLTAVVVPRFIDISSDASKSVLQGVKGALQSGIQIVKVEALIQGVDINLPLCDCVNIATITIDGVVVFFDRGHVVANAGNIAPIINIDATTSRADATTEITTDFLMLTAAGPDGTQQASLANYSGTHVYIYPKDKIGSATNANPKGGDACYVQYAFSFYTDFIPSISTVTTGC